jgi:hypothetical protein
VNEGLISPLQYWPTRVTQNPNRLVVTNHVECLSCERSAISLSPP